MTVNCRCASKEWLLTTGVPVRSDLTAGVSICYIVRKCNIIIDVIYVVYVNELSIIGWAELRMCTGMHALSRRYRRSFPPTSWINSFTDTWMYIFSPLQTGIYRYLVIYVLYIHIGPIISNMTSISTFKASTILLLSGCYSIFSCHIALILL